MAGLMTEIGNEVRGIGAGACGVVSGVNDIGVGICHIFRGVANVGASSMRFAGHTFGVVGKIANAVSAGCIGVSNILGVEKSTINGEVPKDINDDYDDCDNPN